MKYYTQQVIKLAAKLEPKLGSDEFMLSNSEERAFEHLIWGLKQDQLNFTSEDRKNFHQWYKSNPAIDAAINNNFIIYDGNYLGIFKSSGFRGIDLTGSLQKNKVSGSRDTRWILSDLPSLALINSKKVNLVKGLGKIPDMYLHLVDFTEKKLIEEEERYSSRTLEQQQAQQNPKFASYLWMQDAISKMAGLEDWAVDDEFLLENQDQLRVINKYKSLAMPKILGGGASGIACLLKPGTESSGGYVIKFTRDDTEHSDAIGAIDRFESRTELAKTEARIYDAGILSTTYGIIYFIITEQMNTVPSGPSRDNITSIIRKIKNFINLERSGEFREIKEAYKNLVRSSQSEQELKNGLEEIKAKVKEQADSINDEMEELYSPLLFQIKNSLNLQDNWLYEFIEEIIAKYLTSRTDLHAGNLGVTNYGQLRYFDPSYPDFSSDIHVF